MASNLERERTLVAVDIDGTLYGDDGAINVEVVGVASKLKGDNGIVEAFTARDKAEFAMKVKSSLLVKVGTCDSLDNIENMINSVDDHKTETLRQKLSADGITLGKICALRDCVGERELGSYYEDVLKDFEKDCCEKFKTELKALTSSQAFKEKAANKADSWNEVLGDVKAKIGEIYESITVVEDECAATKGDMITNRLKASSNASEGITSVCFLDDSAPHIRNVKHSQFRGDFGDVPVSAVLVSANGKDEEQFKTDALVAEHQKQIEAKGQDKSHANNPLLLEFKEVQDSFAFQRRFLQKVPSTIINYQNGKGETLLHYAASIGDVAFLKALTSKDDVNVNLKDNESKTALDHAVENNQIEAIETLASAGADINAKLNEAVENKQIEAIKALASAGADINAKLNEVVENKQIEAIATLAEAGAKITEAAVSVKDNEGKTALDHAVENNQTKAIEAIYELKLSLCERLIDEYIKHVCDASYSNAEKEPKLIAAYEAKAQLLGGSILYQLPGEMVDRTAYYSAHDANESSNAQRVKAFHMSIKKNEAVLSKDLNPKGLTIFARLFEGLKLIVSKVTAGNAQAASTPEQKSLLASASAFFSTKSHGKGLCEQVQKIAVAAPSPAA